MKIKHIKFSIFLFGIGYWRDTYDIKSEYAQIYGYAHNILIPFCRIQIGYLNSF